MSHSILHHINLTLFGGLQTHFLRFLEYSERMYGYRNAAWLEQPTVHHAAAERLRRGVTVAGHPKYLGRTKIPGWPRFLRIARHRWLFRSAEADAGIIWNGLGRLQVARALHNQNLRCLYWEHGATWDSHHRPDKVENFWGLVDDVLCNSNAAKRMLQLRWGCPLDITVCLNGVAPTLRRLPATVRQMPRGRAFRFGTAGHLRTSKGAHVAIAAIAELQRRGVDAELRIAGTGPKENELRAYAQRVGVVERIHFCGFVSDMESFYDELDCYVHPAMREAFGLVCAEAMLSGCPAIATEIDGLPEVVVHNRTGLCVAPRCEVGELQSLHTELEPRVNCAYDPRADAIVEPRFVAPIDLADAMGKIATRPDLLEKFSRQAIEDANGRLSFERHMQRVHRKLSA